MDCVCSRLHRAERTAHRLHGRRLARVRRSIAGLLWNDLDPGVDLLGAVLSPRCRPISDGLMQLDPALRESAWSPEPAASRVLELQLPLIRPIVVAAGLIVFMFTVRELLSAVFLQSSQIKMAMVAVYNYWDEGNLERAAAMSTVIVLTSCRIRYCQPTAARRYVAPLSASGRHNERGMQKLLAQATAPAYVDGFSRRVIENSSLLLEPDPLPARLDAAARRAGPGAARACAQHRRRPVRGSRARHDGLKIDPNLEDLRSQCRKAVVELIGRRRRGRSGHSARPGRVRPRRRASRAARGDLDTLSSTCRSTVPCLASPDSIPIRSFRTTRSTCAPNRSRSAITSPRFPRLS